MRTNIFQDVLRKVLRYNGYEIKHVMNITDVGHLVSDGDEGEDKMIKSAREENKSPLEIAQHYTELFFNDLKELNLEIPEVVCKATDHINIMLEYVKELMNKGYAYETSTAIYFDISKLDKYPVLSNLNLEEQKAGARVEVDKEKKSPYDFALWIKAPENHLMKWDSPWGPSYPGWHIECSAMGRKYLGEQFDIHTGGIDLIPTHHENEIAQSKGACGKVPARYWMHGEYLLINGGKMSKSLGNVYLLKDIIDRGYEALVYKLFSYSCHYRNKLNFTFDGAYGAQKALERLYDSFVKNEEAEGNVSEEELNAYREKFTNYINDDLNMPGAMSVVWEVARNNNKSKQLAELLLEFDEVLGLDLKNAKKYLEEFEKNKNIEEIPEEIKELVEQRKIAREEKNWAKSDELRDLINQKGYEIKDTKEGIELNKKV